MGSEWTQKQRNKQYSTLQKNVLQTFLISIQELYGIYVQVKGLKESPTWSQLWQVNFPSWQAIFHAQ